MDNVDKSTIANFTQDSEDFAQLFTISLDDNNNYRYNINRSLYFKNVSVMTPDSYNDYVVQYGDTWTNIAYKLYGSPKLWWIICKVNNVKDATVFPVQGVTLKVLTLDKVNQTLTAIAR